MRRRSIRRFSCRRTLFWLRGLSVFALVLAVIGSAPAYEVAQAQSNVGSPFETIVADILSKAPDSAGHKQSQCAVQVICSGFIVVADAEPEICRQNTASRPADSKFISGRTIAPISPPPKPIRQT